MVLIPVDQWGADVCGVMMMDSLSTWALNAVTEADGEVVDDVSEQLRVFDNEHVILIRIRGDGPQVCLTGSVKTWKTNEESKLWFPDVQT